MKLLIFLLAIITTPFILFYASNTTVSLESLTDKRYLADRYYSFFLAGHVQEDFKSLLLGEYKKTTGLDETTLADVDIRVNNLVSDVENKFISGTLQKKGAENTFVWFVSSELEKWRVVYFGRDLPECDFLAAQSFSSLFTNCTK